MANLAITAVLIAGDVVLGVWTLMCAIFVCKRLLTLFTGILRGDMSRKEH